MADAVLTEADRAVTVPTEYWTRRDDGRMRCDVCPRACARREGQRGMCFVPVRQDNAIVPATYGRSSGFCIDPIEKKPLHHSGAIIAAAVSSAAVAAA